MNSRKSDNNKNKLLYDPNQANLRRLGAFSSVQNYDENEIDDVRDEELENLGVTADPIIKSSDASYYRTDQSITDTSAQDGEETGTFTIGEELTKTLGEDKVKFKTASWNKSVSLNMSIGGFALGLVGTSSVYVLWRNGTDFAYKRIFGSDSLNVSVSEDKNTITFSSNNNFAMSIFYTKGSVDVS